MTTTTERRGRALDLIADAHERNGDGGADPGDLAAQLVEHDDALGKEQARAIVQDAITHAAEVGERMKIADPADAARMAKSMAPEKRWTPLEFDFTEPPTPPRELIAGLYPVGTSNLSSATKASGKTLATLDQTLAIVSGGGEWLGREVTGGRALYIHEEDAAWRVRERAYALARVRGVEDTSGLRYLHKQGIRLDDPGTPDRLRREIDRFEPAWVVIDTTTSATSVDLNDNRQAANVAGELRRIADEFQVVIKLLHHRRKGQQGVGPDNPDTAAMGAAAWTSQTDGHETWEWLDAGDEPYEPRDGDPFEVPNGKYRTWTAFRWIPDHNMRDGGKSIAERVVFESVREPRRNPAAQLRFAPAWIMTYSEGVIEREDGKAAVLAKDIGRVVWAEPEGAELATGRIAERVGEDAKDPTFKRALGTITADTSAKAKGYIARPTKPDGTEKARGWVRGPVEPPPSP
jgi:AAA domain